MQLRPWQPEDRDAVIRHIDAVYKEYGDPGVYLENYDADLLDVDAFYTAKDGAFVVGVDAENQIIATHATMPIDAEAGLMTFRRLYLHRDHRGGEAGTTLMQWAIDWAVRAQFRRVEFWSDVRFTRAHQFFRRFGFETNGQTRTCEDHWEPYTEYFFWLDLPDPDAKLGQ